MRGYSRVITATEKEIVLEVKVGRDGRITIPAQIRNLVKPDAKKILTLKDPE